MMWDSQIAYLRLLKCLKKEYEGMCSNKKPDEGDFFSYVDSRIAELSLNINH